MEFILIIAVMGVAMYFLMIRPARKQQQKQQQMMNALEVGSRVMLGSGIYGTIRHLGDKQAIIEISPGVDLTILRAAIRSVVTEDEEEFEYSDDSGADEIPVENMDAFEADIASPFAPDAESGYQPEPETSEPELEPGTDSPAAPQTDESAESAPEADDSEKKDEE